MKRTRTSSTGTLPLPREGSRVPRSLKQKNKSLTKWKDSVSLGLGFPKMLKMTHKYCETVALTSTAGVLNSYTFSTNGLYDPNISSTGHQPYYFDQVGALYDHYCVIGSKVKFTVINTGTNDPAYGIAAFVDDDTATSFSSLDEIIERQTGKFHKTPAIQATHSYTLTLNWSAKKYFGKDPLSNTELQGTIAANPTEQSFFKIAVQANGAANVTTVITAEIEYIAVWKEIKEVAQS